MTHPIRFAVSRVFAGIVLGLLVATSAPAAEPIEGRGIVMGRDIRRSTLQIENRTFHVRPSTVFENAEGEPLTFDTLPVFDVHQGLFSFDDATKVEFVAHRTTDGEWELEKVQIVTSLPK